MIGKKGETQSTDRVWASQKVRKAYTVVFTEAASVKIQGHLRFNLGDQEIKSETSQEWV